MTEDWALVVLYIFSILACSVTWPCQHGAVASEVRLKLGGIINSYILK